MKKRKLPRILRAIGVLKVLQNSKAKFRLIHPFTWLILLIAVLLGLVDILKKRETPMTMWIRIKHATVWW